MRLCYCAPLAALIAFQLAAQVTDPPTLTPEPLDFANRYGTWITGKAYQVQFSLAGGTDCHTLTPGLGGLPAGFTWTPGGAAGGAGLAGAGEADLEVAEVLLVHIAVMVEIGGHGWYRVHAQTHGQGLG